jgi:hypothetical protein
MLNQDYKTFTTIIDTFLLANPDFQLSKSMKEHLFKIDNPNETFSTSDGYKLYSFIFKVWSIQHNILLKSENRDSQELLHIHIETLYQISQKFENSKTIQNSTLLKDEWLSIWEYSFKRLQLYYSYGVCNDLNKKKHSKQSYILQRLPSGWNEWEGFLSQYLTIILMPFCVIILIVYAIFFDK